MVAEEVPATPPVQQKAPTSVADRPGGSRGEERGHGGAARDGQRGPARGKLPMAAPESRSVPLTPRNACQVILEAEGMPPYVRPTTLPETHVTIFRAAFPSPFQTANTRRRVPHMDCYGRSERDTAHSAPRTSWTGWDQLSRQQWQPAHPPASAQLPWSGRRASEPGADGVSGGSVFEVREVLWLRGKTLRGRAASGTDILASAACAVTTVRDAESWVALGDAGRRGRRFRRRLGSVWLIGSCRVVPLHLGVAHV